MRNYKMLLAYDGARYKGWQRLGNSELTIQQTIEEAIEQVTGICVEIQGSGRTDAGVHASGQAANFKISFLLEDGFQAEMNRVLPEDIRVLQVELVASEFHSRFSAKAKTYKYYVDTREKAGVFTRKYSCHYPNKMDLREIEKAAAYLTGTHDFSSFTDDKTEGKSKVRTIYEITLSEQDGMLEFTYYGDGFLQHMIRILTGTLLEVGSGAKKAEDMMVILAQNERSKAGFMAPAKGLFLEKVYYT